MRNFHPEDLINFEPDNIFIRILRGLVPCDKVYEDKCCLAFRDINPQASIHVVVIPTEDWAHRLNFGFADSDPADVGEFFCSVAAAAEMAGLRGNFRMVINTGPDAGQQVPYLHVHLLGGESLGPIRSRE